mgnify:CR=1 FL=1
MGRTLRGALFSGELILRHSSEEYKIPTCYGRVECSTHHGRACLGHRHLSCGTAPGNYGIPREVINAGKKVLSLTTYTNSCYNAGKKGQCPRTCDANIITLYKNKGYHSDCKNHRGISLLIIVGKAFARVVLNRLHSRAAP